MRHSFLGLCTDAGQKVLAALMQADRVALCGLKGVPDTGQRAVPGGSTASQIVLCADCGSALGEWRIGLAQLRVGSQLRSAGCHHA